jgi:TolA-binding protein
VAKLFKQADMLFSAREAAREEDTAKAKKLYEKLIADYKDTEAAKRAKAKLDDLGGGN